MSQVSTDYLDSSALVKRYLAETGSGWVQSRCYDPAQVIATVDLSRVEIAAAFASKLRGKFITPAEYQLVRTKLATDAQKRYHLLPIDAQRVDEAISFLLRPTLIYCRPPRPRAWPPTIPTPTHNPRRRDKFLSAGGWWQKVSLRYGKLKSPLRSRSGLLLSPPAYSLPGGGEMRRANSRG